MALFGRYDQDRAGIVNYHEFVDKLMEVDFYDVTQVRLGGRRGCGAYDCTACART